MAQICDGDIEAMACLFRRHARVVYAIAYRVLRDTSEADDLVQEYFSWFIAIARHSTAPKPRHDFGFSKWPTVAPSLGAAT